MTKSTVWVVVRTLALFVLVSASGAAPAAESKSTGTESKSAAAYTKVMFVVSAPEKSLRFFTAIQEEKVFKDSECKKSSEPTGYKRDFLRPQKWQTSKYGDLVFIECSKPTAETFQLFAQASLNASADSPGRTVKMQTDTITVTDTTCQSRFCSADNSFHQAYPRPKSPCGFCP